MFLNKHVQILLQNNMILEGVVKYWDNNQVIIVSLDDQSASVILHPKEDIRIVKILKNTVLSDIPVKPAEDPEQQLKNIENKFKETYQAPSDNDLRLKNLVDLKSELIRQEKLIIANKLKEHTIGEVKAVKYEQPRLFKKQESE